MSEVNLVDGSSAAHPAQSSAAHAGFAGYTPERLLRRMLAAADVAAVAGAAVAVGLWGSGASGALLIVLTAPIWIVTAKLAGLYDRDHRTLRHLTIDELPWLIFWALAGTALLSLLVAPFPGIALANNDRLLVWAAVLGLGAAFRASTRALWRRTTPPERVLILGEGPLAQAVERKLELFPDIHAEVSGRIADCTLLNERPDALDGTDRVILASSELNEELLEELLTACRVRGVKLTVVPPTRGMFGTATHLTHVADLPLLDYNTWYVSSSTLALKRVFDLLVGTIGLIVTLPIFGLAAVAILVDDGRPVFFRQQRVGEGGRRFRIFKFRTMVRDAEARFHDLVSLEELDDPLFKLEADPRVTRSGRFLRRTSIDELPQLLNVLRGEMSIVGPRPELVDIVERYRPEHEFRLQVKPGITGPWQVFGRSDLTFDEILAVEREYVENLSLARDIRIVLMTLPAVLGKRGAY
jgi:exopolysaccharide biosynthesis polyprenyl glycosylphosphotransferase